MFLFLSFISGLIIGSFLNAWIWRAHVGRSVMRGRSMCPQCQVALAWYDNVPLLSFLWLRGKCRACNAPISWQYPLVELKTAALFVLFFWLHSRGPVIDWTLIVRDWIIVACLVFIFVYDLLYQEILDGSTLIIGALLFIANIFFHWHSWQSMLIGVAVAAGFFLLQYVVSRGRWIGGGDIRLGVFMGIILGWPTILVALFVAYVCGAGVSLVLLALKKQTMNSETPFGTYLAVATVFAMLWGERIAGWYLALIKI